MTTHVAELTSAALRECGTEVLVSYERSLCAACEATPPPFGFDWYGDAYRQLAINPYWLIQSLISNAAKEGEGATELWNISGQITDTTVAEAVRRHAIDESRHSRYYIRLLSLAFPGAADEALLRQLIKLSPGYKLAERPDRTTARDYADIIDLLIQTNLGEIRTRIHQLLMRPVLIAFCPSPNQSRLLRILDSLLVDETRHIQYTARIIERACGNGYEEFVHDTIGQRLDQFNRLTTTELGKQVFAAT